MTPYPCPCCGHRVFVEPPGSYDICEICFWEDDNVQLRWPDYRGGANVPSLIDSQENHREFGAIERRFIEHVRPPRGDKRIEPGWRPIDRRRDSFEPYRWDHAERRPWPDDLTVLYWWRPTFWGDGA